MKAWRMHGKWSQPGVPHKGWRCIDIEDLGAPDAVCEMCERRKIRFIHYMQHPGFEPSLGVGCVCAEKMEDDYDAPKRRESNLKNVAQRRKRWLSRKWNVSHKGNSYLNTDGFNIAIFPKDDGSWAGRIEERSTGRWVPSRREYKTEDQAKLAALDAMIFLKNERGWGRSHRRSYADQCSTSPTSYPHCAAVSVRNSHIVTAKPRDTYRS